MSHILCRLFKCTTGTAAVEAAIFAPIFLTLTLGITDLGTGMFTRMTVNAATQAGAAYAVVNYSSGCATSTASCINGIETAMNDATGMDGSNGQLPFCTAYVCSASLTSCPDPNGGNCFTVSASAPFTPILPSKFYSWSSAAGSSSPAVVSAIVRVK